MSLNDKSEEAKEKLTISGYADLNGLNCQIKVAIEEAKGNYGAKNIVGKFITPDDKEYDTEEIPF